MNCCGERNFFLRPSGVYFQIHKDIDPIRGIILPYHFFPFLQVVNEDYVMQSPENCDHNLSGWCLTSLVHFYHEISFVLTTLSCLECSNKPMFHNTSKNYLDCVFKHLQTLLQNGHHNFWSTVNKCRTQIAKIFHCG